MDREREIAAIRARLARLDIEKAEFEASLTRLLAAQEIEDGPPSVKDAPVSNASSPAAKIALFRSLFRGREEVFPKRWDNAKTGKAGYAPACANEWVPRICENIAPTNERLLIATGRYIGEGFDDARLDTLFLTMPIAWKGTLAQYVGRLHRLFPAKREVIVYDYVDEAVPVLKRMSEKRLRGYKSLGYSIADFTANCA
jgi:hypothetical protein